MANVIHGIEGAIKVAGGQIGQVKNWQITASKDIVETTTQDVTNYSKTHVGTLKDYTGSCLVILDYADANQATLATNFFSVDDEIALTLYPDGEAVGDVVYTCNAIVTGFPINSEVGTIIEAQFDFQVTGGLTQGVVPVPPPAG